MSRNTNSDLEKLSRKICAVLYARDTYKIILHTRLGCLLRSSLQICALAYIVDMGSRAQDTGSRAQDMDSHAQDTGSRTQDMCSRLQDM